MTPLVSTLLTLLAGTAGGAAFWWAGLPAGWLSGSMVAVGACAIAKVPLRLPATLRDMVFVVLGISMGAGFTPEALGGVLKWPLSLLGLALSIPAIVLAVLAYLVTVARWDRPTAFFAAVPGALAYIMVLALESRADPRRVALSQSIRLFILVALLPSLVVATAPPALSAVPEAAALDGATALLVLLAAGTLGAFAFHRLGIPAGLLTGALAASAVLHGTGLVSGQLPDPVLVPCFVAMGCVIGLRFEGASLALAREVAVPSLGACAISLLVAASFASAVSWSLALPLGQVLLAFAPGGIEAMTILAFVLGADPAYVSTHQLARFVALSLLLPLAARPYMRRPGEPSGGG